MLCAASLPCRSACWAVIARDLRRAGSGPARRRRRRRRSTSGWPGTLRYSSTTQPALARSAARGSSTSGSGRTPTHQISDRVGTYSPSVSRTPSAVASVDRRAQSARRRRAGAAPGRRSADSRWSSSGSTRSARRRAAASAGGWPRSRGCCGAQRVGEQLRPARRPRCRCSRRRPPRRCSGPRRSAGSSVCVGQLDLADDVVAQVQRLGDAAEAVRVLGDAGDRQQLVDAADGEHQPVVGRARRGRPPGRRSATPPVCEVDARRPRRAPAARRAASPASETATRRGSSTPAATSGSSGR